MATLNFRIKWCSKCNTMKQIEYFPKRSSSKDGRAFECRVCQSFRSKSYYRRNRQVCIEKSAAQRRNNATPIKRISARKIRTTSNGCLEIFPRRKLREKALNDRAKKAGITGKVTSGQVDALLVKQAGRCANCGRLVKGNFHLDHIKPIALGGRNVIINIQILCPICNGKKGAMDPIEFMRKQGFLL